DRRRARREPAGSPQEARRSITGRRGTGGLMFERFTDSARRVVTGAQDEARQLGTGYIGSEHLFLALLNPVSGRPAEILRDAGLDRNGVVAGLARPCDQGSAVLGPAEAEALRMIGIDLDAVVAAVTPTFGPGARRVPPGGSAAR